MSFVAGETFLFPLRGDQTPHLWIVATTPGADELFAIVSLTSLKGSKDQTVVLRAGEHPFIRWDTCVAYGLADLTTSSQLQDQLARGMAELRGPVSRQILALVVAGFTASPFTKSRL